MGKLLTWRNKENAETINGVVFPNKVNQGTVKACPKLLLARNWGHDRLTILPFPCIYNSGGKSKTSKLNK